MSGSFVVRTYANALPRSWFSRLTRGIDEVLRDSAPGGRTFWHSFADEPRLLPEHIVRALRRVARPGPDCTGAEWWVRAERADRPKQFHFDRDETLFEQ